MKHAWQRALQSLLSVGGYPDESPTQRTKRRIFVGAATIGTILTIPFAMAFADDGYTLVAANLLIVMSATPIALVILAMRPLWFPWVVNGVFVVVVLQTLFTAALVGGLLGSSLDAINVLIIPLAALMIFGRRASLAWFCVFVITVIWSAAIPNFIEPTYDVPTSIWDMAQTLIGVGIVIMAITLYFVRQRDYFQQQSDDLLHNILPDAIATRLKGDRSMIADDFPECTVLFADVVGFTPMSAGMSPPQLVGLLNSVFTKFDEFVAELGLEKIKTVGDEYMVAGGVPLPRPDHAEAVAELALRIRDHVADQGFAGHRIALRIGINSGPVVAGIIGTHKFSYDLWGDTVNTASRMESEGVPGEIQVSAATENLLRGKGFACEPRGAIPVKGKGEMQTFLLVGRARPERPDEPRLAAMSD
jgi:adenylate cyclase